MDTTSNFNQNKPTTIRDSWFVTTSCIVNSTTNICVIEPKYEILLGLSIVSGVVVGGVLRTLSK